MSTYRERVEAIEAPHKHHSRNIALRQAFCDGVAHTRFAAANIATEADATEAQLRAALEQAKEREAFYLAATRDAQEIAAYYGEQVALLRGIGGQMSNVCFNWSQEANHVGARLDGNDRNMLANLRKQWDEALAQQHKEPSK